MVQAAHASTVFLTFFVAVVFSLYQQKYQRFRSASPTQPNTRNGLRGKHNKNPPEAVLEPPRDVLQVLHPASSGGLSALSLLPPLKRPQLSSGVSALGASYSEEGGKFNKDTDLSGKRTGDRTFVLPVEGAVPATPAKGVGLGVSLTAIVQRFVVVSRP